MPNQILITDTIKRPCNKGTLYTCINLDSLYTAMMRLHGEHFKVWCYFAENAEHYSFKLSSKDVCEKCNIGRDTFTKALTALKENGYLVETPGGFAFYDWPSN